MFPATLKAKIDKGGHDGRIKDRVPHAIESTMDYGQTKGICTHQLHHWIWEAKDGAQH